MAETTLQKSSRGPANPKYGGVSVIFPVHNESFIIEQVLQSYIAELSGRIEDVEFIVVEDGSVDGTKAVLDRLRQELPIRLYMSDQRKGYQQAVKEAMKYATKPWLFVVDSDYQFAAIDFWRIEPLRDRYDIIMGIKKPRKDPFYRIFLSWGFNVLLRFFFKVPYRDMDTGFRLYSKHVAEDVSSRVRFMSFFNAEFVIRAHFKGYKIAEVPVKHYARKVGSTTIFYISRLFAICFYQFIGIIRLWRELKEEGRMPAAKH